MPSADLDLYHLQVTLGCPLRWDSASQSVAVVVDFRHDPTGRALLAFQRRYGVSSPSQLPQCSAEADVPHSVMDLLEPASAPVPDVGQIAAASDSSNLQHAAATAVRSASCREPNSHKDTGSPSSSSSSSIPLLDTELPDLSSDSVSSEVGYSDEDGDGSVPHYQMLLIWSMQHMRLVEVNLGFQREEFAWYSFAGRPWAPSKPLLAALSSEAEGMEAGKNSTFVIVVDINGAQQAAMSVPGAWGLAWSPDSCYLAANSNNTISILTIDSGVARSIARPGYGIAWSPNSTHLMCCGAANARQCFLDVQAGQLQEVASSSAQLGMLTNLAWHGTNLVASTQDRTLCFKIDDCFQLKLDQDLEAYDGRPAVLSAGGRLSIAGVIEPGAYDEQVLITQVKDHASDTALACFPTIPGDGDIEFQWNPDRYSLAYSRQHHGRYLRYEIFLLEQPDLAGIRSRWAAWQAFRPDDTPDTQAEPRS